jgi:hypothetical protein
LQELGKEIKESSHRTEAPSSPEDILLSGLPSTRNRSKGTSKVGDGGFNSELLLKRTHGIYSGIAKLDVALRELRRNLKEYLENVDLVEGMLQQINNTAGIRYSMIDTYLKMDENSEAGESHDYNLDHTEFLGNYFLFNKSKYNLMRF